jgi:hypothetical protein
MELGYADGGVDEAIIQTAQKCLKLLEDEKPNNN